MKKALIIYGSTTGNTEDMAGYIAGELKAAGIEPVVRDVAHAVPDDLAGDHDLLILGCPAYGDETVELQDDFQEFYERLDDVRLNGKLFAVFAPGDSSYEHFCGSVDLLTDKMAELGGRQAADGLKIDGDPKGSKTDIAEWTHAISEALA